MLKQVMDGVQTVAIGGHIRPDGDCVGSCLGLYQYLKTWYPNVQIDVYLEPIPTPFHFIEASKDICNEIDEEAKYDLFIALDCADANRLGFSEPLFRKATHTFCVDHHISNPKYAEQNYVVAEASSTAELVCQLLEEDKINKEMAECLFLGIVHDTGVFQYSSTSPETMEKAAMLMRKGINASWIIDKTYYEKTYAQNLILGRAILDSSLSMEGKCLRSYIDQDTMAEFNVTTQDLEGIVSHLRMTKDVEVAVFLYQLGPKEYKVSMRSNGDVDVSVIAQVFHGGGHKKAAGVTMEGTPEEIISKLEEQIQKQL